MMENSNFNNYIDYFKLFKIFDLKKIEKTGQVKILQDKILNRKIVSVEGAISTANFVTFSTINFPNISFAQRYFYIQGFVDPGKSFCLQITLILKNKIHKAVYSTLYKTAKKHLQNIVHLPLKIMTAKWNIIVIDLYQIGTYFDVQVNEMRLTFKVQAIEIRASSKVKNIFQSDYLFTIEKMPKELGFPLQKQQNFYSKYHYSYQQGQEDSNEFMKREKKEEKKLLGDKKEESNKSMQKIKNEQKMNNNLKQETHKRRNVSEQSKKSLSKEKIGKEGQKSKTLKNESSLKQIDHEDQQQILMVDPPRPQGTISMELSCLEGFSFHKGNITAIESFLVKPVCIPVHKPIKLICESPSNKIKLLVGYEDGSICLWNTVRKQSQNYFKTELQELKLMLMDEQQNVILVGLDKLKREVINIVKGNEVIFRQISNYNMNGMALVCEECFEFGIVSFGFENIRLWKIKKQSQMINGMNVYLGQTHRKVTYKSCVTLRQQNEYVAFVGDSNGYITTISINQGKMINTIKLDSCAIDHLILKPTLNNRSHTHTQAFIANQKGHIKLISLENMQILEEFSLNTRVKEIACLANSSEIILTHYNQTIANLNLQTSVYTFMMRSHTANINKIVYNNHLNKLVTISEDNTIRIWAYVSDQQTSTGFRIQQQYEFLIQSQSIIDICTPTLDGNSQSLKFVFAGSDSGKIRKIDLEKFEIVLEKALEQGKLVLSTSKNGKYLLVSYLGGNSYLLDDQFNIVKLFAGEEVFFSKKSSKKAFNGFNEKNKCFFITNLTKNRLQFYSLRDLDHAVYEIEQQLSTLSEVQFNEDNIYLLFENELKIYEKATLQKIISLNKSSIHQALRYPLHCSSLQDKLYLEGVLQKKELSQFIDMPEEVANIIFTQASNAEEGIIFCTGIKSYSIYAVTFHARNIQPINQVLSSKSKFIQNHIEEAENNLEVSFSKHSKSFSQSRYQPPVRNATNLLNEKPKDIRSIYEEQQKMYEEVKSYLFPSFLKQKMEDDEEANAEDYEQETQEDQQYDANSYGHKIMQTKLTYGFDLKQYQDGESTLGKCVWMCQNKSLILLANNMKTIIHHFFRVPVTQKAVHFTSKITSIGVSSKSTQSIRYMAICTCNLIKLYNINEQIRYVKGIESICSKYPKNSIFQCEITDCNGYLVLLSHNQSAADGNIYIHVLEISSCNIVSSSYLSTSFNSQLKNKSKSSLSLSKELEEYKLVINRHKPSLEFIIYHKEGIVHFYRITAIFTLQTIEITEIMPLVRNKISYLTSAIFISPTHSYDNNHALLIFGTYNGSLVFLDSHTASILIVCVSIVRNISGLNFVKGLEQSDSNNFDKLILFESNSCYITIFNLEQGINSLLQEMQSSKILSEESNACKSMSSRISSNTLKTNETVSLKQLLSVDGEVSSTSNMSASDEEQQQLIITKCGTLWLVDYSDMLTIKILNVHVQLINHAQIITLQPKINSKEHYLITCSEDCSIKITNLQNLQQVFDLYKPKKEVKTFCVDGAFAAIAFNNEICFYSSFVSVDERHLTTLSNEITSIGSLKVNQNVISIKNIPETGNYYVMTESQVLMLYVKGKGDKNKGLDKNVSNSGSMSKIMSSSTFSNKMLCAEIDVQIHSICDVQYACALEANVLYCPFDQFAISSKPGKINIWSRKCLKRTYNPVEELSHVHSLEYYLIDSYSKTNTQWMSIHFISDCEYFCGVLGESLIQCRNYKEHSILREINLPIANISFLTFHHKDYLNFYVGDQYGYFYVANENGLVIEKTKVFDGKINGIQIYQNQIWSKHAIVYGTNLCVVVQNLPTK